MSSDVRARAVSKHFGGGSSSAILNGVDVTAPAGRITTILGESGCGKTTLLRIVAGLETATSGEVYIGDREVSGVSAAKRGVAMVFQNYGLYPAKTVQRNIEFPLKMSGVPRQERAARAERVARILHIEHVMDRLPAQLSGGQRQRVGICRALVRDPEILLMDEPLSNLDAQLRIEMRSELVSLQREVGSTMLYVTHDQVEAMTMSDSLVVMRGGRVEQLGTPLEVFSAPATAYVAGFLGNMNVVALAGENGIRAIPSAIAASGAASIGIRPEHLQLAASGPDPGGDGGVHIEGRVVLDELHGTDRVLHVRAGDVTWRARIDSGLGFDEHVRLRAAHHHLHLFDATGSRRAA